MGGSTELGSGGEEFSTADFAELSSYVATKWRAAGDLDWSVQAGTVEWTCLHTADHAVDCVWAPTFFLASRRQDRYPDIGADMAIGEGATPARLVESLEMATRVLCAVIADTPPDVRSVIFRRPEVLVGAPRDFAPRAAVELILHAHDVSLGLGIEYEPEAELCCRLREHTRPWPMWTVAWQGLPQTNDPWLDLLIGSGRQRHTLPHSRRSGISDGRDIRAVPGDLLGHPGRALGRRRFPQAQGSLKIA